MSATVEGVDLRRLRLALMSLGSPPQAQRHHLRVGLLQRACRAVAEVAPRVPGLHAAGAIDATQAAALDAVGRRLAGLDRGWEERMPTDPGGLGFDFLQGDAFEDPEWESLRLTARDAFTAMRAPDNPRVG